MNSFTLAKLISASSGFIVIVNFAVEFSYRREAQSRVEEIESEMFYLFEESLFDDNNLYLFSIYVVCLFRGLVIRIARDFAMFRKKKKKQSLAAVIALQIELQ